MHCRGVTENRYVGTGTLHGVVFGFFVSGPARRRADHEPVGYDTTSVTGSMSMANVSRNFDVMM